MNARSARLSSLVAAALLALGTPLLGAGLEERFEKTFDLQGITKVTLENVNGPVRLDTWDRPHFKLVAVKKAKGRNASEALRETQIHVGKEGSVIVVETRLPRRGRLFGFLTMNGHRDAEVSYELLLPPGMATDVETVNGKVTAFRRTAHTALSTVNGSIRVEGQEAPLRVNTVNGSVEILFSGPSRAADVETVNGSVEVAAAPDSSFHYELQTVNGSIRSDFGRLEVEKRFGPKEARGEVNGGRERLAIETVNGEIRIRATDAIASR